MENKKYYFLTPDIGTPAGGIKVIYQMVDLMNKNGYDAYILHIHRKFKCMYAKTLSNIKYAYAQDGVLVNKEDVLFIPEPDVKIMQMAKNMDCKKIVFNQNWAYTFHQFREINNQSILKYQDLNFNHVLTVTQQIEKFLDFAMNGDKDLSIGIVPPYLSDVFAPKKLSDKIHQIAFMPRKNFNVFQDLFSVLYGKDKEIRWVQIDNMAEEHVAELLKESTMFLSMGYPEGFSLPPLEAMKSGCVVLGYSGYGGLEYMRGEATSDLDDTNMFLFPDGDILNMAKKILQVWRDIGKMENMNIYQTIADNGVATAKKFTKENTEKLLLNYLTTI